ncbi:MAG TPA: rhomboid family intramembrane serine protease [Sphingomonas sp.]|jgi:membrane associated rhomboid family serine protease|nr:rhomboid family intramembrane serine protease [Sphingomonas sp.]
MTGVRTTRATNTIAVITCLAWAVAALTGRSEWVAYQLGFIPVRAIAQGPFLIPYGLTPLTATLAHGGLIHLAFNMLLFVYCGRILEATLGWPAMLILYGAGAYGAAVGQYFAGPSSAIPMIGASGAISAVLAVYALLFGRNEVKRIGPIPSHWVRALWLAAAWMGMQALIAVATLKTDFGVATAAHVGGFLAGLILARPLLSWRYGLPKS